jgi:DNA helicase IV
VGWHRFPHPGAATLFLEDAIAELLAREPRASLAVLTRNRESAARWAGDLAHLDVRWVRDGEFTFTPGVDVCEVSQSKGLEFDYVIVVDADFSSCPSTDEARRLLHVAVTRAMHQLWICSVGTPSPLLPWPDERPRP